MTRFNPNTLEQEANEAINERIKDIGCEYNHKPSPDPRINSRRNEDTFIRGDPGHPDNEMGM